MMRRAARLLQMLTATLKTGRGQQQGSRMREQHPPEPRLPHWQSWRVRLLDVWHGKPVLNRTILQACWADS